MPYPIMSTIRRATDDDMEARSCTFYWSNYTNAFSDKGLILVHHKEDGSFERVRVDHTTGRKALPEVDSLVISGRYQPHLHELAPGEETKTSRLGFPERYYRVLELGETYSLIFPGAEVGMWAWGSIQDNLGLEMKAGKLLPSGDRSRPHTKKGEVQSPLVIPGAAIVTFTAVMEEPAWPERASREAKAGFSMANLEEQMWRLKMQQAEARRRGLSPAPLAASDRVPCAPIFSVSLQCPSILKGREDFGVEVTFKYEGLLGEDGQHTSRAQPVTFHWLSLLYMQQGPRAGFRLYRRRRDQFVSDDSDRGSYWDQCELDGSAGCCMIVDEPDIAVCVGEHKHFTSLQPGETWTTSETLSGIDADLPRDTTPGDIFRYTFKGAVVDWWDWGTMEDHAGTVVKLPCFEADSVTVPSDNGGRPKLVVTGAEPVEFTIVE